MDKVAMAMADAHNWISSQLNAQSEKIGLGKAPEAARVAERRAIYARHLAHLGAIERKVRRATNKDKARRAWEQCSRAGMTYNQIYDTGLVSIVYPDAKRDFGR